MKDNFFAGHLSATPDKITLRITGELYEGRGATPEWNSKTIACSNGDSSFILFGLKAIKSRKAVIPPHSKSRSFFEMEYEAKYLIYSSYRISEDTKFLSLTLWSKTINQWLGNTKLQEDILSAYHSDPSMKNISVDEFEYRVQGLGRLGMSYHPTIELNSPQYKSSLYFPPYLYVVFDTRKVKGDAVDIYNKLHNLFIFLAGDEIEVSKIELSYDHRASAYQQAKAWLYYPKNKFPERYSRSNVMFARNVNLRHKFTNVPELQGTIFNLYFNGKLDEKTNISWFIEHYNTYKRRLAIEEKFLGYFRLLEKLCYSKSSYVNHEKLESLLCKARIYLKNRLSLNSKNVDGFIGKVKIANQQKYNSEKQILDFYKSLPEDCTKTWLVKGTDLGKIVSLRNNITHANQYNEDRETIEKYTKFIEALLIFALSQKIGIDFTHTQAVIPSLNGYHFLRDMSEGIS